MSRLGDLLQEQLRTNKGRDLRNLLNRAAAALETPGDLSDEERLHLIEDLTVEANNIPD